MRKVARGPGAWAIEEDLWNIGPRCGVGRSFVCLPARGAAIKLRVLIREPWEEPIRIAWGNLRECVVNSDQWARKLEWNDWYLGAFVNVLYESKERMREAAGHHPGEHRSSPPGHGHVSREKAT